MFSLFFDGVPNLLLVFTKVNEIIIITSPHITTTTQGRFSRLLRKRVERFQSKLQIFFSDRIFFFVPCPLSRVENCRRE